MSDLDILNSLFPDDINNNKDLANEIAKGPQQNSKDEKFHKQMKGAFGMGPLGKVALPARLEDAQILEVQPGIVTSVNVPTQEGLFGTSNVRYARGGDLKEVKKLLKRLNYKSKTNMLQE